MYKAGQKWEKEGRRIAFNRTSFFVVISFFILLSSQTVNAADQILYVRSGGTGTTCSDWTSSNACGQLNSAVALVNRASYDSVTIYVADGTYTGATIDSATSGTKVLTIMKATALIHGTSTGWDNSYGDGQALFQWITRTNAVSHAGAIRILTSYVTLDGGVLMGTVNNVNSYGFRIIYPADIMTNSAYGGNLTGIYAPDTSATNRTVTNVKILRSAIEGPGDVSCINGTPYSCTNGGIQIKSTNASNMEIAYNYFYGWAVQLVLYGAHDINVHNNYFDSNSSGSAAHGEQIVPGNSMNVSIYNNIFYNSKTAVVGFHGLVGTASENSGYKIYNNLVYKYQAAGSQDYLTVGFGCNDTGKTDTMVGAEIYHNTFVDVKFLSAISAGTLTDVSTKKSYAFNNLFYNCSNPRMDNLSYTSGAIVHDNNAYLNCTGNISSADETAPIRDDNATDPFIQSTLANFKLKADTLPIKKGKTGLGSTYALDFASVTRNTPPSVGMYEYVLSSSSTPTTYTLITSLSGSGIITSSPSGISCGSNCSYEYTSGITVTLSATANKGYTFSGWSGDCSGADTCTVTMTAAKSVTATFIQNMYTLTISKPATNTGTGAVNSSDSGISCGSDCSEAYSYGTNVTLTAAADSGSAFYGWSGDCTGTSTCQVTIDAVKNVSASFLTQDTPALITSKKGTGKGKIKSTSAMLASSVATTSSIDCGDVCVQQFENATKITLTAEPESGSTFAGWEGACSGTGTCVVTVNAATTVTATFTLQASSASSASSVGVDGGGGGGGCFIATAAYGSYLDSRVIVLREFRDNILLKNYFGRMFVKFYYAKSPAIAYEIGNVTALKVITRVLLTPVIYAIEYSNIAFMIMMIAALLIFTSAVRRKRLGNSHVQHHVEPL